MHELLKNGGKLVGLLFDDVLNRDVPPFGGSAAEYKPLFDTRFTTLNFEPYHHKPPMLLPLAGEMTAKTDCTRAERFATRRQIVESRVKRKPPRPPKSVAS